MSLTFYLSKYQATYGSDQVIIPIKFLKSWSSYDLNQIIVLIKSEIGLKKVESLK